MIKSFKDKQAELIWDGKISTKMPHSIQTVARRKLRMINNATNPDDLRIPPDNHLEQLLGNRKGQHSIRINLQWRICFIWDEGAEQVEIVDYH